MKILVVHDHSILTSALSSLLRHAGHVATIAISHHEALLAVARGRFDLCVFDTQMEDGDCFVLLKQIRKTRDLFAIAMTATDEDVCKCKVAGFDHCLVKPITLEALFNAIGAVESYPRSPSEPR